MASFLQRLLARALPLLVVVAAASGPGCGVDEAPGSPPHHRDRWAQGRVRPRRKPLPEIPLPDNVATWPNPEFAYGPPA